MELLRNVHESNGELRDATGGGYAMNEFSCNVPIRHGMLRNDTVCHGRGLRGEISRLQFTSMLLETTARWGYIMLRTVAEVP